MKKALYLLTLGALSLSATMNALPYDSDDDSSSGAATGEPNINFRRERAREWLENKDNRREAVQQFLDKLQNVNIRIDKGTVTLTGTIDSDQDHQQLLQRLNKVLESAKNVQDQLKISKAAPADTSK